MDDPEFKKFFDDLEKKTKEMQDAGMSQKEISREVSALFRKERKRLEASSPPKLWEFITRGIATAVVIGFLIWLLIVDESMRTAFLHWWVMTFLLGLFALAIYGIWWRDKK